MSACLVPLTDAIAIAGLALIVSAALFFVGFIVGSEARQK